VRSNLLRASVVLAGLAISPTVFGYNLIGWYWRNTTSVSFQTNVSSFPSRVGTATEVENALVGALLTWGSEGDADFEFTHGGNTTQSNVYGDNTRRMMWLNQTASGGTLAVAQSNGWGSTLTDCDIYFYSANGYGQIDWSASATGAAWYELDLQYVALHESGHCAGLDHSGNANAIMYASAPSGTGPSDRSLHSDDRTGLQAMYGVAVGNDMVLSASAPITAGTTVPMLVTGADPGEIVHLIATTAGVAGATGAACPTPLNGGCLDLNPPVTRVAYGTANNQGSVSFNLSIPSSWAAYNLAFQAVMRTGSSTADVTLSNTVDESTLGPGATCPSGQILDCAGNCYPDDWPGDGYCDDGTTYQWGSPDFDCATFNFDQGDC
jgi:hypothetical protein